MPDHTPPPSGHGVDPTAQPLAGARPGGLLDRFLARLIDGVLLAVVNGIIGSVVVVGMVLGESGTMFVGASTYAANVLLALVGVAITLGYFAALESSRGQTLGKMALGLRVVAPTGGNPSVEQAIRRNVFLAFGLAALVPLVGGLLGSLAQLVAVVTIAVGIHQDTLGRRAWHDRFAGDTQVLKVG